MTFAPGYREPWDPLHGQVDEHPQVTQNVARSKRDDAKPYYREHAILSAAAYNPSKFRDRYMALGYTIDPDLSQKSRTVFYNPSSKKAVIAYKGMTPSINPIHSDIAADIGIAAAIPNYLNGRFRGAVQVYNQTKKKYGKRPEVLQQKSATVKLQLLNKTVPVYNGNLNAFQPGQFQFMSDFKLVLSITK